MASSPPDPLLRSGLVLAGAHARAHSSSPSVQASPESALVTKPGREGDARRWVLLGTFPYAAPD